MRGGVAVPAAEISRPAQRRHRHAVQPLLARPRQTARRINLAAVSVRQQPRHHARVERRIAAFLKQARTPYLHDLSVHDIICYHFVLSVSTSVMQQTSALTMCTTSVCQIADLITPRI